MTEYPLFRHNHSKVVTAVKQSAIKKRRNYIGVFSFINQPYLLSPKMRSKYKNRLIKSKYKLSAPEIA